MLLQFLVARLESQADCRCWCSRNSERVSLCAAPNSNNRPTARKLTQSASCPASSTSVSTSTSTSTSLLLLLLFWARSTPVVGSSLADDDRASARLRDDLCLSPSLRKITTHYGASGLSVAKANSLIGRLVMIVEGALKMIAVCYYYRRCCCGCCCSCCCCSGGRIASHHARVIIFSLFLSLSSVLGS